MVFAMSGAVMALKIGIHPLAIYAVVSGLTLLFVWFGEYTRPFQRAWYPTWRDNYGPDTTLFILNNFLLQSPTIQLLIAGAAISLAGGGFAVWPHHWPLWIQVPIGLVIAEFGSYWPRVASQPAAALLAECHPLSLRGCHAAAGLRRNAAVTAGRGRSGGAVRYPVFNFSRLLAAR
jgi:hypothetical protein